jgi:hypothetical protein
MHDVDKNWLSLIYNVVYICNRGIFYDL